MPRRLLPKEQVLELLAAAPSRISALTKGLEPAQLQTPFSDEGWSLNDVLAHLRSCADMWGGSMVQIAGEHATTLRAINPRTWIKQTDYPQQEFHRSLRAYTKQRRELVAFLEALPPQAWQRKATITGAGKPIVRTVLFYGDWLALHERSHVKQIERVTAALRQEE